MDETPTTTTAEVGARLRAAREAKGLTLDSVIKEMWKLNIPDSMTMSRAKVNQLEKGVVVKPDPWDLLLLATIFGVELSEVSPQAADDIRSYRGAVTPIRTQNREADPHSPCTPDREPVAA